MLDKQSIISILVRELPDLAAIYLFGSHASAENRPQSDIDLGILPPYERAHTLDFVRMLALQEKLASTCGCDVDLINLRLASTVLAKEVVVNGHKIYCQNQYDADEFEMHTLSLYQKLNEERREILRDGLSGQRFYEA